MGDVVRIHGAGDKKPPADEPNILDARDTLSARLTQARALVSVLGQAFDDEDTRMPGNQTVREALWGIGDLLNQAEKARDLVDEHLSRLNGVT